MSKQQVYDVPTRVFHNLFAVLFIAAFIISKVSDDESSVFAYHMIFGVLLATLSFMRILWGFFGTKYARFSTFELNLGELIQYMKDALFGKTKKYIGHNPASSYAALAMIIFPFLLCFSGYNMVIRNNKHFFGEIHELVGHLFFFIAIAHIVGIVLHTKKHKELIGLSMLHGQKDSEETAEPVKNFTAIGIVMVLVVGLFGTYLVSQYSTKDGTLTVFNQKLQVIEMEDELGPNGAKTEHEDKD